MYETLKAIFYGICPISPKSIITICRWFESPANHIVILECLAGNDIVWIGPEYPRDMLASKDMEVREELIRFEVKSTRVYATGSYTEFQLRQLE